MSDLDRLRALEQEYEPRLVAFTQKLIQTPSLPGEEGAAARLVREEMHNLGYDDTWIDAVGNVVGVIRGSGAGRSLMLNTHLDHVAVGDESGWRYPPHGGEIHDGAIWGRGAMDIKGPTAAQVYGAALLKATGVGPEGDVYVVGAVQEEVGGLGSIELGRTLRTDRAVVGEASGNELRRGHRGRIELIVRIQGRSSHASMPDAGINPEYSLGHFLTNLRSIELTEDPFLGRETFAPSLLYTDQTSSNVVPGEVTLHIDWRTLPGRGPEEIRAAVQRVLDDSMVDGATGTVSVKEEHLRTYTGEERDVPALFPSFLIEEDDEMLREAEAALEEAYGHPVPVKRWEFATDAGHLAAAGIPSLGFGPGNDRLAHTNEERIDIRELTEGALGNAALALRLTRRE